MKKSFIIILPLIFFASALIYIFSNDKHQEGEYFAILHQFNPLVKKEESYLKTKRPDKQLEYNRVSYTQSVYNEKGKSRKITFEAIQKLKTDHYLKIKHKGAHVETFEEVSKNDVPQQALKAIEKE